MKTLEQKAKAYDEALERAKKLYEQGTITESLSYIFPELKESEDERIRKELISLVKYTEGRRIGYRPRITQDEMITWLEKQKSVGEIVARCKKSWYNEGKIQGQIEGLSDEEKYQQGWHDALEKQGEQKPRYSIGDVLCDKSCTTLNKDAQPNFEIVDIRNGMYICDKGSFPISQQDEYELVAKKIEPKFHEGDWVVWQDKCYKVNYNGYGYELIDQNGLSTSLEYGTIDTSARLWDITKDAKDGDVLVSQYGKPFIYNGNRDSFHIGSYCGISVTDKFNVATEKCHWTKNVSIQPATKEQRDTLFAKMKEAGYEWDAEKKELNLLITNGGDFETNNSEQNPAWSEDDEDVSEDIEEAILNYWHGQSQEDLLDWLKSLKGRVNPSSKE